MNNETRAFVAQCKEQYSNDLTTNVLPFWLKYGLDHENGGVYTCLDRDGSLIDKTKSVWFQGRFGFICAYAYNNLEKKSEWLDASKSCIDFIEKYCFDTDGHMFFEICAEGKPLRKRRYVFSECFATIAMAEYALASGDTTYATKAVDLFKRMLTMLGTEGFLSPKFCPSVKMRGHSITMMLINVAMVVKKVSDDPILDATIDQSISDLEKYFIHPEFKALLETVTEEGEFIDTCTGRVINPGHCIETAWFLFEVAAARGNDQRIIDLGLKILDWSWEWGWDEQFGGIINFRDCRNLPCQDYAHDMKFWWPQCETIIATLYAYKLTKDEKYLTWHKMIHDYTYTYFPDKEYGEWYGYLHRDGSVSQPAKGNIFKGPFHIPRMMIKSALLCEEILK